MREWRCAAATGSSGTSAAGKLGSRECEPEGRRIELNVPTPDTHATCRYAHGMTATGRYRVTIQSPTVDDSVADGH